MKRPNARHRVCIATSALCLVVAPSLLAQAAAPETEADETIVLSPFVVEATEDTGYTAKATLAGTRIRTELKDVGSAITVVTPKFLQDTNSKNSQDLLVYTTGTEVAGQGGNFTGGGDSAVIDTTAYTQPVSNTRVRGLAAADNVRDFFLTDIPWDSYNVGRVDLQRGPNSILFGIGSPAGIINSSVNPASFKDSNKVEAQVATYGTYRGTVDINKVILKDELAVRVAGLWDNTKYRQNPAHRDDHRLFSAVRFDPHWFNKGSAHTSFRANFEKGSVSGTNPRLTPPMDAITPWFTAMSKVGVNYQDSNNLTTFGNAAYNPWLGSAGNRIYDGLITNFEAGSGIPEFTHAANVQNYPANQPADNNNDVNGSYKGIVLYDGYAFNARMPGYVIKPYKAKSLTDASIFDFYNNLIEGPNKKNWTNFRAYNLNLSQTFFDNKLGFELAYDNQLSRWGYKNFISGDAASITVDVMRTLMDGSTNPNFGRPMIVAGGGSAGSGRTERLRESTRATAFGELDFRDVLGNGKLAEILGRQLLTYSAARQEATTTSVNWANWWIGSGYGPVANIAVGQAGRDVTPVVYLGNNLTGASNASNLQLPRIRAVMIPQNTTVTQWDTVSQSFTTYQVPITNADPSIYTEDTQPYTQARKNREQIDSQTIVWQGYFFGGNVVPMFGWRKDIAEAFDAGSPAKTLGVVTNYADPEWRLPTGENEDKTGRSKERIYNKVTGQTRTWSLVVHVPQSLMRKLPGQLGFSVFYNQSENFQPDASRTDILGGRIASPTGETKDYGFAVSMLDQKITLKVNRYETSVANATLSGELGNSYLIGAGEAWGHHAANELRKNSGNWPGDGNYGTTTSGQILRWQPADTPQNHVIPGDNSSPYTQAAIDAQYAIQVASVNDWFAHLIPESMQRAWGMTGYTSENYDGSWSQNSVAVTGDTLSKGTEFEIIATPVQGLDISFNASKTDAKRLNIGKAYSDWIEQRWEDYQGPMGDMRLWGNGNWALQVGAGGTVRDKFANEVMPNYQLALALNNSTVPELRPWRYNLTANYAFRKGRLEGANIGASYRWEDKQVVGFQLNAAQDGYDVSKKWYGPSEDHVDFWIGYQRKITSKILWRAQINIRDLFASKTLIPVTVQPDGSPAAYRIPEPRIITLTNSFEF